MRSLRRVRLAAVVVLMAAFAGGCFHGHYHGGCGDWHASSCGDGGLIFLGVLGIAWGISAIAQACGCH